jgi:hypothetical protein
LVFASDDKSLWALRENMPWPTVGDELLDPAIGSEGYVYTYEEWIPDDLDRLSFLARQYQECARDLVRQWLKVGSSPESIVYVVGFLYRHALELNLKAIITRHAPFRSSDPAHQAEVLKDHSLRRLWNRAKELIAGLFEAEEVKLVERLLLEVHELDAVSDGFRYPFGFLDKSGHRKPLLAGLAYSSFDNFVWILDGLNSWLRTTEDIEYYSSWE